MLLPARRLSPALVMGLLALALSAPPAHAGPPWISVELPANPHDPATRGALLVLHTYHHGTPVAQPITCMLEGIVKGDRRSVACQAVAAVRGGVYAIRGAVPTDGVWMLVVTSREEHASAQVLVDFSRDGQIAAVRVPARSAEGGRWSIPTPVGPREIDAMLRTRWSALSRAPDTGLPAGTTLAGLGGAALLALVFASRRRAG